MSAISVLQAKQFARSSENFRPLQPAFRSRSAKKFAPLEQNFSRPWDRCWAVPHAKNFARPSEIFRTLEPTFRSRAAKKFAPFERICRYQDAKNSLGSSEIFRMLEPMFRSRAAKTFARFERICRSQDAKNFARTERILSHVGADVSLAPERKMSATLSCSFRSACETTRSLGRMMPHVAELTALFAVLQQVCAHTHCI